MADSLLDGISLGQALTNQRCSSVFELQGTGRFQIKYQFVPASAGPFAQDAQDSGASTDLESGMLYFKPKSSLLPFPSQTRLGRLRSAVCYYDADGVMKKTSANVAELFNIRSQDVVELFFGLDALEFNRKHPVFTLGPVSRNCVVTIFEKPGKLGDLTELKLEYLDMFGTAWYSGVLSGDTWKECSPPFQVAQARAILARAGVSNVTVDAAMQAIYGGEIEAADASKDLFIDLPVDPAPGSQAPPETLRVIWDPMGCGDSSNPGKNVCALNPQVDVQVRVHPFAYAAVIAAALACDLQAVRLTSSWRPMLGSTGHRHADSLDVGSLTERNGQVHLFKWMTLEPGEQEKLDAETALGKREAELEKMKQAVRALEVKRAKRQMAVDSAATKIAEVDNRLEATQEVVDQLAAEPEATTAKGLAAQTLKRHKANVALGKQQAASLALQRSHDAATTELEESEAQLKQARDELAPVQAARDQAQLAHPQAASEWQSVVDAHLPAVIRQFRSELLASPLVRQIIDPWGIDFNTRDQVAPVFNERTKAVEKLHLTHLHVTCIYAESMKFPK